MALLSKIIMKLLGWTVDPYRPKDIYRSVMVACPHTSNWDFIYARLSFFMLNIPIRFTIKDEYVKGPFGWFFKKIGAIGIDRSENKAANKKSTVDAMADLFKHNEELVVLVTPEGTRSLRTKWKTGFYFTALKAKVPISLAYLDFEKKRCGVGKIIYPTEDIKKDMKEIMHFYKSYKGKYPEKFSVDLDYA